MQIETVVRGGLTLLAITLVRSILGVSPPPFASPLSCAATAANILSGATEAQSVNIVQAALTVGSIVLAIYLFTRFSGSSSGGNGRSRCVHAS